MQAKPNNLFVVEYGSNPPVAALVKNWEIGKEYTWTVRGMLKQMDDQRAEFVTKEIGYDPDQSEADGKEEEAEINPSGDEPVMLTLGAGKPPTPDESATTTEKETAENEDDSGKPGSVAYVSM